MASLTDELVTGTWKPTATAKILRPSTYRLHCPTCGPKGRVRVSRNSPHWELHVPWYALGSEGHALCEKCDTWLSLPSLPKYVRTDEFEDEFVEDDREV